MRNNNQPVIRKLTFRSFRQSKMHNIFVVLAIVLTTLLITTIFSIGISFVESGRLQLINMVGTLADAGINSNKLTEEQLAKSKSLDYIKAVGIQNAVATINNNDSWGKKSQLYLFDYSESEWDAFRKPVFSDIVGGYPQKYNEIMAPVSMLSYMGIETPQLGMEIPIEYLYGADKSTITPQTFILTGYFTEQVTESQGDYGFIVVSSDFAKKCIRENPMLLGQISFQFTDSGKTREYIQRLEQDLSLQTGSVQSALPISGGGTSSIIAIALFVVFIMLTGYLLIYNVLYISISKDIQFYGLLKAIGTTPKQIRKIVVNQALVLSAIGIPLGLITGGLLSLVLVPKVIETTILQTTAGASANPLIFAGAAFFALVTVLISTLKPAVKASKITPIAAMRYTEGSAESITVNLNSKKPTSGGKIHIMAWRNVFRDKKRAVTVLISLFLGITVFLVMSNLLNSMDLKNFIASSVDNDFDLQNTTTFKAVGEGNVEKFDEAVLSRIQSIPGIRNLNIITMDQYSVAYDAEKFSHHIDDYLFRFPYYTSKKSDYGQSDLSGAVLGIDSSVVSDFNKNAVQPVDIAAFERGELALIETNNPEHFEKLDTIDMTLHMSGKQISLPIGGFIPWDYQDIPTPGGVHNLYVSKVALEKWSPSAPVMKVIFDVDETYNAQASQIIETLFGGDSEVSVISKSRLIEQASEQTMIFSVLGSGLSAILALIGIFNFLNIMVTSIMSRKRELAILESIGMTKQQIKKMTQFEGLIYAMLSVVLVLTIGSAAIYGTFLLLRQMATYVTFSYPLIPLLFSVVMIGFICIVTPVAALHSTNRASVVERLRELE